MDGDEQFSGLWVLPLEMRIGAAVLPVGGIAGVGTKPKHRNKGYAARCMRNATAFMKEQRFALGLLFGIPDFYHRYGYAVALQEVSLKIQTRDAEGARRTHRVQAMRASDRAAALRLHRRANALRTGTRLRTLRTWQPARRGTRFNVAASPYVAIGKHRRLEGCMMLDKLPNATVVSEIDALSVAACESLIAFAAQDAIAKRAGELTIHAPADHKIVEIAGNFGSTLSVRRPRCGGGMARVIDQECLLQALTPELSRRAQTRPLAAWRGAIGIRTELGMSYLRVRADGVKLSRRCKRPDLALELPQQLLAQLVTGYRGVENVLNERKTRVRGKSAHAVLSALFPRQNPYMWCADRF